MRLRPHQLACILLLLSTCHLAGATVLPVGEYGFRSGSQTYVLLDRLTRGVHGRAHLDAGDEWTADGGQSGDRQRMDLSASSLATVRTAWTMKAPAAQCTAIYSNTGSEDQNGCALDASAPVEVRLMFDRAVSQSAS